MQSSLVKAKLKKKRLNFKINGAFAPLPNLYLGARTLRHIYDKWALRTDCKFTESLGWMCSVVGSRTKGELSTSSP